ncbi:MAG: hypothetical protein RBT46_02245 [Weeksellaceae bacterium]|nr:hypothetical protein [Weeksellaceae bacterium]
MPKFLIADSSDFPEDIYILHTEFPRFLMNVETDEIEWFDALEEEPDVELENEIAELIEQAYEFFDKEMDSYEE